MGALVSVPPPVTGRLRTCVRMSLMPMAALWVAGARIRAREAALLSALHLMYRNAMPQKYPVTMGCPLRDAGMEATVSHR